MFTYHVASRRAIRHFFLLLIILVMGNRVFGQGVSAGNVLPGDEDYPVLNPHQETNLVVSGRVPAKWDIQLSVEYAPKNFGVPDPKTGVLSCGWFTSADHFASQSYSVVYDIPNIIRSGHNFQAAIPVDRYQEGRCGWHLSTVGYTVLKSKNDSVSGFLAKAPIDLVPTYPPIDMTDRHSHHDFWCWDNPLQKQFWINGTKLDCELAHLMGVSPMKYIPSTKRGEGRPVYLFQDMKTLSFTFHDLDAEAQLERAK